MPPDHVASSSGTRLHPDAGFLLSNLLPSETGVEGAVIWFSAGEFAAADSPQGPRLLVVLGQKLSIDELTDAASVRLTGPPEVVGTLPDDVAKQAAEFAQKNRDALLGYWKGNMSTRRVLDLLERV